MATTAKKQGPVFKKRYFPVQVAVFEHRNGDNRANFSVVVTRSFRREEGAEWENTEYLSAQDLLPAAKLLEEAYSFIQERQQETYEKTREEEVPY